MDQAKSVPLARQARIAGLCYLVVIVGGLFAEGVVRGSLIVPGDAAATAEAIAADESLWRWGLTVHLLYLGAAVVVDVLLYGLLKRVQATLARLALVLAIVDVTIEAVNLLRLAVPLAMVEEAGALAALAEGQRQALAYLAVTQFATGFAVALVFFSGFCVLTGALILRSRRVPRAIGALMIAAGACYLVNSLVFLNAPALSEVIVPWILLPSLVGELSLALWLVARGARLEAPGSADRSIVGLM